MFFYAETTDQIRDNITKLRKAEGPALMEIRVHPGARKDLGRPTTSFQQSKEQFMKFLQN